MYDGVEMLLEVSFEPMYYVYPLAKPDLNVNILTAPKDPLDAGYN